MGSRYPLLPASRIVAALKRAGFEVISQKGSHLKLKKAGRPVVVPMHDEVARGTLRKILEHAGMELEAFLALL